MSAQAAEPKAGEQIHVLCPHCHAVNRIPRNRAPGGARCGSCHAALFQAKPVPVDEAGFDAHVRRNDIPVLIDVWAPWCGPCRAMAPAFEEAARRLEPAARLLKLNADEAQATAARFGVRGIPALLLFDHGRLVAQSSGAQSAEAIIRWVRSHMVAPPDHGG